jgi:hypothetical protein
MTPLKRKLLFLLSVLAVLAFYLFYSSLALNTLRVHVGKPYGEVVRDSTFSVKANTVIYPSEPPRPSSTWITSPVVIQYDDPSYGFTLPAIKFGAITYGDGKVIGITTSPMLEMLSFSELVPLLEEIQSRLKRSGWTPQYPNKLTWLLTTTEQQKTALQDELFKQVGLVLLGVPHKYTLAINIKCFKRCNERNPATAKYLIDISMGRNYFRE